MGDWVSRALANIETEANASTGVQAIRAAIMKDGAIDATEVRKLLAIHKSGTSPSGEADWSELLVEAIVDYFATSREVPAYQADELQPQWGKAVYRLADTMAEAMSAPSLADMPTPLTYAERMDALALSDVDANLLIDALGANGDVLDAVEIRLVATLFGRAVSYPATLREFAWRALEATVKADGVINDEEVSLIRALIMGPASFEGQGVSQTEAEALFRMDKNISEDKKADLWPQFFASAIGSHLLYEGATHGRMDDAEKMWLSVQSADYDSKGKNALAEFLVKSDGKTD